MTPPWLSKQRFTLCYSTLVWLSPAQERPTYTMSIIEFRGVNKFFGDFQVLKDIDFTVDEGEVVVVIGPSGSGKSTLLRCINALEQITTGELIVDGMHLNDKKTDMNKVRTEIGMVFQQFN